MTRVGVAGDVEKAGAGAAAAPNGVAATLGRPIRRAWGENKRRRLAWAAVDVMLALYLLFDVFLADTLRTQFRIQQVGPAETLRALTQGNSVTALLVSRALEWSGTRALNTAAIFLTAFDAAFIPIAIAAMHTSWPLVGYMFTAWRIALLGLFLFSDFFLDRSGQIRFALPETSAGMLVGLYVYLIVIIALLVYVQWTGRREAAAAAAAEKRRKPSIESFTTSSNVSHNQSPSAQQPYYPQQQQQQYGGPPLPLSPSAEYGGYPVGYGGGVSSAEYAGAGYGYAADPYYGGPAAAYGMQQQQQQSQSQSPPPPPRGQSQQRQPQGKNGGKGGGADRRAPSEYYDGYDYDYDEYYGGYDDGYAYDDGGYAYGYGGAYDGARYSTSTYGQRVSVYQGGPPAAGGRGRYDDPQGNRGGGSGAGGGGGARRGGQRPY